MSAWETLYRSQFTKNKKNHLIIAQWLSTRWSFLYIFCNCRYYHCCTLNSTEKILRSSKNILCIKHCEIQPYLYELIHVFQHTKIASLHYQNIQWYCCVLSVNTLTCTVWIFPCIPFFLYCEVPLRRHLWLCCNISNVISLHVSHDYVLRITWQKKKIQNIEVQILKLYRLCIHSKQEEARLIPFKFKTFLHFILDCENFKQFYVISNP